MTSSSVAILVCVFSLLSGTDGLCPTSDWTTIASSCYLSPNEKANWYDAEAWCLMFSQWEGNRPFLANIEDSTEQQEVSEFVDTLDRDTLGYWIGASDSGLERVWRWDNMDTLSYTNWANGYPSISTKKNCLVFSNNAKTTLGLWKDAYCHLLLYFVCEVPVFVE